MRGTKRVGPRPAAGDGLPAAVAALVEPGELVAWSGRPDAAAAFLKVRGLWWFGVPAMAVALALGLELLAAQITFVAALVCLLIPPGLALTAARTVYVLTDRRAIACIELAGSRRLTVVDLDCADAAAIEILRLHGDVGAVLFVPNLSPRVRFTDYTGKFGFWDLRHPEAVAIVVRRVLDTRRRSRWDEAPTVPAPDGGARAVPRLLRK